MSYELNAGGKQLAEVIEKVTWSGDSKQVARKLVFTVANKDSDRFLPKVNINEGDQVQFLEDGKLLFSGPVFDIEKSGSGNVVTYTAYDSAFGSEIHTLIGSTLHSEIVTSELKRFIIEALMVNPYISELSNFQFTRTKSGIQVEFDCTTIYGAMTVEWDAKEVRAA